ncbi:hypothetical protein BaRGS_00017623 [Batillaria attramentaria]|uniref:C-type lectin domain-containing protein n=1 Tax=Batillaria attramentaria TaxID=370345 RepID=A0ABD0KV78_9CAEN
MFFPYLLLAFLLMNSAVLTSEKQIVFKKKPGILHLSPHSEPNVTCPETSCSLLRCANACVLSKQCALFSYSEAESACVVSDIPETEGNSYDTLEALWDTYEIECPLSEGYALYTTAQSSLKLCLKYVSTLATYTAADDHCKADGARLARVKTQEIVDVVNSLRAGLGGYVWVGADDTAVQGDYRWNDGTPLLVPDSVWAAGEPNSNHERCVMAKTDGLGDLNCAGACPFICQFRSV